MGAPPVIVEMLRDGRFDAVIPIVTQAFTEAAAGSTQQLNEVARDIVRWQGVFKNTAEASASEPYFRTVYILLQKLAGADAPVTLTAAQNLAGILGTIGKLDEAISLHEMVFVHLSKRYKEDDQRITVAKNSIGALYRRAGRDAELNSLYANTGLCEHLQPAEKYLVAQGNRVISVGQPWSMNCRVWVYFDALIECEHLIDALGLASCVQPHDHRGTHDGSERGLVCTIHHDGIMGRHPTDT